MPRNQAPVRRIEVARIVQRAVGFPPVNVRLPGKYPAQGFRLAHRCQRLSSDLKGIERRRTGGDVGQDDNLFGELVVGQTQLAEQPVLRVVKESGDVVRGDIGLVRVVTLGGDPGDDVSYLQHGLLFTPGFCRFADRFSRCLWIFSASAYFSSGSRAILACANSMAPSLNAARASRMFEQCSQR